MKRGVLIWVGIILFLLINNIIIIGRINKNKKHINRLDKTISNNEAMIKTLEHYRTYTFLRLFEGNCNTQDKVNHTNYYSDVWKVYIRSN